MRTRKDKKVENSLNDGQHKLQEDKQSSLDIPEKKTRRGQKKVEKHPPMEPTKEPVTRRSRRLQDKSSSAPQSPPQSSKVAELEANKNTAGQESQENAINSASELMVQKPQRNVRERKKVATKTKSSETLTKSQSPPPTAKFDVPSPNPSEAESVPGSMDTKRTDFLPNESIPLVMEKAPRKGRAKAKSRSGTKKSSSTPEAVFAPHLELDKDPPAYEPGPTVAIFRRSLQEAQEEVFEAPPPFHAEVPLSGLSKKETEFIQPEESKFPTEDDETNVPEEKQTPDKERSPDRDSSEHRPYNEDSSPESTPILSRAISSVTNIFRRIVVQPKPGEEPSGSIPNRPPVEVVSPYQSPGPGTPTTDRQPSTPCFGSVNSSAGRSELDKAQERGRQLLRESLNAGERPQMLRTVSEPPRPKTEIRNSYIAINHGCLDDESVWTLTSLKKLASSLQLHVPCIDKSHKDERTILVEALNLWNRDGRVPQAASNNSKTVSFPPETSGESQTPSVCNFHNLPVGRKEIPERWTRGFTPLRKESQLKSILRTNLTDNPPQISNPMVPSSHFLTPSRRKTARINLSFSPYNSVATFMLKETERTAKQMRMMEIAQDTHSEEIEDPTKELAHDPQWQIAQENAKRNIQKLLPQRFERGSIVDAISRDSVSSVLDHLSPSSQFADCNPTNSFLESNFPSNPQYGNFPNRMTPPTPPRPRPEEEEEPISPERIKRSRDFLEAAASNSVLNHMDYQKVPAGSLQGNENFVHENKATPPRRLLRIKKSQTRVSLGQSEIISSL
eukprot:GHVP01002971.1.p1 GENE.GHVP01002971.1~~GHVP01002971.1.p1  ORF type:complete len:788 (+),score=184.18 GHVP01002971.1:1589-3952(+)